MKNQRYKNKLNKAQIEWDQEELEQITLPMDTPSENSVKTTLY